MVLKTTLIHIKDLCRRKEFIITFYVLLVLVLGNYLRNVILYQGRDVTNMYQPMKLLSLSFNLASYNGDGVLFLIQIYPFLVVLPAGFSLAREEQTGEHIYISSRIGRKTYIISKVLAAFCVNVLVFTIPFFIEIILNCIAFPLSAAEDLSNWSMYEEQMIDLVEKYFMSGLYIWNPYVYAIVGVILFGVAAGLWGALTVAISAVIKIKYRVFLFIPSIVLLNLSLYLTSNEGINYRWYEYVLLFTEGEKNILYFSGALLTLSLLVLLGTWKGSRKDSL